VPKSRVRKKPVYTPPPTRSPRRKVSPPWLAPTMVVCLLVCGFALIVAGVVLATKWH
jgi:Cell division protein CrgA